MDGGTGNLPDRGMGTLRHLGTTRPQPVPDSRLLVITGTRPADQQFGAGQWDRSLTATLITALHDAGASAIGIDIPLDLPSPPNLGAPSATPC